MKPAKNSSEPVLIIGVGNAFRHDDGVGRRTVQAIDALNLPYLVTHVAFGEGTDLINLWADANVVIVVDAAASGAPPGTIHRLMADKQAISPVLFQCSTHAFGVAEAVELSRLLGQLPQQLIVYAVEGQDYGMGEGLSCEVAQAVPRVVDHILNDLNNLGVGECLEEEDAIAP